MRIIMGVLAASSGTISLDAQPLNTPARSRFGYMPSERGLYPKMHIGEQITYLARLHGFTKPQAAARTQGLLDRLGLGDRINDPLEALSMGNQQRVQVAAALVHEPDVLILDEPFSGLDPMAVDEVVSVLNEQAAAGAVVLFSSHQLDVVERLCDDLIIIGDGRVLAAGEREELRARHGTLRYQLSTGSDAGWVRQQPGVEVDEFSAHQVTFRAEADAAQQVLSEAVRRGPVSAFTPLLPDLSEIFREFTSDAYNSESSDANAKELQR